MYRTVSKTSVIIFSTVDLSGLVVGDNLELEYIQYHIGYEEWSVNKSEHHHSNAPKNRPAKPRDISHQS